MYRDPNEPMLYDFVTRLQLAVSLYYGYDGESRESLEQMLLKSADITLDMQSVTGEIPFGGRSNQFLFNEAAFAAFYDDIAHRNAAKETEFPSLDPDDYEASADGETDFAQANTDLGMPFTGDIVFPSLDLDDYVEKQEISDAPKSDGEEFQ